MWFIVLWFWEYKNPEPEYFYKTDAQFQKEQQDKYHPELTYSELCDKLQDGLIRKKDFDKAVELLIKDIFI